VVALYLATNMPAGSPKFGLAMVLGAAVTTWFASSVRYEVTLTLLAAYLCLADGYVKLGTGNPQATFVRDILFYAIVAGAAGRLFVARGRVKLPPLTPWIIGFIVIVVVQVFNPNTLNTTKALAGLRQQLEFVPLFFFGYALLQTTGRLRGLLLAIAVFAAINGIVGLIQSQLTPDQLAGWGPGYRDKVMGAANVAARVYYDASGAQRTRPFGLGGDVGFAGGMGMLAVPMVLALLSAGAIRRAWVPVLLGLCCAVGVITSQGRTLIIGSVIAVLAFLFLGLAGRSAIRAVGAVAIAGLIGVAILPAVFSGNKSGGFDRYASIAPDKIAETAYSYRIDDLSYLPEYFTRFPLGAGLATVGPARAFGGAIPRPGINGETEYNFMILELGIAGLLLFTAFSIKLIALAVRRLPRVEDIEARTYLAGLFAPLIALFLIGFAGPTTTAPPFGPYLWLMGGVAAYWLAPLGSRRRLAERADGEEQEPASAPPSPSLAPHAVRFDPQPELVAPAAPVLDVGPEGPPGVAAVPDPGTDFTISVCLQDGGEGDMEKLQRAIARIHAASDAVHEIVVHAGGVDPAVRAYVAEQDACLRWSTAPASGPTEAWSAAAAIATGSHVVLLDTTVSLDLEFLPVIRARWAALPPQVRGGVVFAGWMQYGLTRVAPPDPEGMWLTSAVLPRRLLEVAPLEGDSTPADAAISLAARATAEGYEIVQCPEVANWGPAVAPRVQPPVAQGSARLRQAARRARRRPLSGTLSYAVAVGAVYAGEVRRRGPRGLVTAARTVGEARSGRDAAPRER
jgi:hypothetical protein